MLGERKRAENPTRVCALSSPGEDAAVPLTMEGENKNVQRCERLQLREEKARKCFCLTEGKKKGDDHCWK